MGYAITHRESRQLRSGMSPTRELLTKHVRIVTFVCWAEPGKVVSNRVLQQLANHDCEGHG